MPRRMIRRDPIESEIELALSPGEFIRDRAAGLYEIFLAGCREKADHPGIAGEAAMAYSTARAIRGARAAAPAASQAGAATSQWSA
jgi:hypothetical protein